MRDPVHTTVWPSRADGAPVVVIAVHASVAGSYWPPVLAKPGSNPSPPQTSMRDPVDTAVWDSRADGAPVDVIAVHASVAGSYWPPVLLALPDREASTPPQTSMRGPVHTAVWAQRADGAPVVVIAVHASVAGSYWPPVLLAKNPEASSPPQTSMRDPVHTAVWDSRADGAPVVVVAVHVSVAGSYWPPVLLALPDGAASTAPQSS